MDNGLDLGVIVRTRQQKESGYDLDVQSKELLMN